MSRSKFYDKIRQASIEREIEVVYNEGLALYFDNAAITHPFACDGLIDTKEQGKLCKLIMEYKVAEHVFRHSAVAIDQQLGAVAARQREFGYAVGWQGIVVVGYLYLFCIHFAIIFSSGITSFASRQKA